MNILLKECASAVPKKCLTNVDLEGMVDTSDEWIFSRTGIKKRYILEKDENLSDLCIQAAKRALDKSDIEAGNIDLIIVATSTPDNNFPSIACSVQAEIKADKAVAFDISAACSGFLYALEIAKDMLGFGKYANALIIGADALSKIVDWENRETCVLFGDAAGACILGKEFSNEKRGIIASDIFSDGSKKSALTCATKGDYPFIKMNGQEVFKFAVRTVPLAIENILEKANISKEDIKMYILHQANIRIIEAVAKKLNENIEKFPTNLSEYGNTSAGSIILLLDELIQNKKLKKDDLIVLSGFGAGLTWAVMLIKI